MKVVYSFYAADRYWPNQSILNEAYLNLLDNLEIENANLITDEKALEETGDVLVVVPMSGAVQPKILADVKKYKFSILYGGYIEGNAENKYTNEMLKANAAPTLMDTWAVLHRNSKFVKLATDKKELEDFINVFEAYDYIKGSKLLKIGNTEPWVVSNASDTKVYEEKFGIEIIKVEQSELADLYNKTNKEEAKQYYDYFIKDAKDKVEPSDEDIWNASRMAFALNNLLNKYEANGAAIACFNLLKTGTTVCLGASYLNDQTDKVISCECDMDSAVTMLFIKKLTKSNLWMANPAICKDKSIHFSHCTGPTHENGCLCNYVLRNHHESSIGVSLQIDYPINQTVSLIRISNEASDITIQKGTSIEGPYKTACRSQLYIKLDDFKYYIDTALGCHQVIAFEDIFDKTSQLAKLFNLNII